MKTATYLKLWVSLGLLIPATVVCQAKKPELIIQTGHSNFVTAVAFSPDGKILASGADTTIRLWDISSGMEMRSLIGHRDQISALVFSSDGKTLASASAGPNLAVSDSTVKLWDVTTGTVLNTLSGGHPVFSPDGRLLAYGGKGIKLWNVAAAKEVETIDGDCPVGFGPAGKTLVGIDSVKLKVWNVATGTELRTFTEWSSYPSQAVVSADGRIVADIIDDPGARSALIELWDIATGLVLLSIKGAGPLAFTPDSKRLAAGTGRTNDSSISLWDIMRRQEVGTLIKATNQGDFSIATSGNGTGSFDQVFRPRNPEKGVKRPTVIRKFITYRGSSNLHGNIAFSPSGQLIASGLGYAAVGLWDTTTGKAVRALVGHVVAVPSVAFSDDGRMLATGSGGELWGDNAVKLWNLTGSQSMGVFEGHANTVKSVAFSPDSKILASGSSDHTIKLWNAIAGTEINTLRDKEINVNAVVFSSDTRLLAAGRGGVTSSPFGGAMQVTTFDENNPIDIWDVVSGKLVRTLEGNRSVVQTVAFSPDGRVLMSGASDSSAETSVLDAVTLVTSEFRSRGRASSPETMLWDVTTGAKIRTFAGMGRIFSPDGKLLAIETVGNGIELCDASTGAVVHSWAQSSGPVAFSSDGQTIAFAGERYSIGIYNVATGAKLRTLAGHTNRIEALAFSHDSKFLASGNAEARTKLWDVRSGEEIVSLIALDERDWLVVTPDGLFDGSPAAWNRILWRFSQRLYDVAPVEAFFSDFYYPGLLADIFAGKRPHAVKDISQRDRRQPQLKVERADNISSDKPLTVRNVTLKIGVSESAADKDYKTGSGVQDVRVFRNGSLVKIWRGDAFALGEKHGCKQDAGKVICEVTIPIVAGENRITAYAFNHDNIKSEDATLIVTGGENSKRSGTAYIVAIGVNEYANSHYNLQYAVADARSFASQFEKQQTSLKQFSRVKIIPLLDSEANKANILNTLRNLTHEVQPEDGVFVYFAGHGIAQGNHYYLIPQDIGYQGPRARLSQVDLDTILKHSISDEDLQPAFEKIDGGHIVLVLDTCDSGQVLESEEKRRGPMNSKGLAQLAYEKGMYVLTATESFQAAREAARLGHGFLTYALVEEGLKTSAADTEPKDKQVTLREWLDYAAQRVPRMQLEAMQQTRDIEHPLAFVEGEEKIKDPAKRNVQTPRVFYRREPEAKPLIVARL